MRRMICVTNKNVADELAGHGYRYMTQNQGDKAVFTFVESEDLYELLSDKKKFSKKHWYVDKRLRF